MDVAEEITSWQRPQVELEWKRGKRRAFHFGNFQSDPVQSASGHLPQWPGRFQSPFQRLRSLSVIVSGSLVAFSRLFNHFRSASVHFAASSAHLSSLCLTFLPRNKI
jgi:hypothetical protein